MLFRVRCLTFEKMKGKYFLFKMPEDLCAIAIRFSNHIYINKGEKLNLSRSPLFYV